MNKRISGIDNAKALGILLVIYGHALVKGDIHHWIYSFHMPMFFILSGYCFKQVPLGFKDFLIRLKKYFMTIVVPYILLMIIAGPFTLDDIKNYICINRSIVGNYPLTAKWYLPCLFVCMCMVLVTYQIAGRVKNKFVKNCILLIFGICFFYAGYQLRGKNVGQEVPWFANVALMASSFVYWGMLLKNICTVIQNRNLKFVKYIVFVICLFLSIRYHGVNPSYAGGVVMVAASYGKWAWFLLNSWTGSLAIISLAFIIPSNKVLSYIGQNTLPIMMFHGLYVVKSLSTIITNKELLALTAFLLTIPIVEFVNRYMPVLVGKTRSSEKLFEVK